MTSFHPSTFTATSDVSASRLTFRSAKIGQTKDGGFSRSVFRILQFTKLFLTKIDFCLKFRNGPLLTDLLWVNWLEAVQQFGSSENFVAGCWIDVVL
jgi:hypothetical protein